MSKPLRILMVEDSEDDALLMIQELKKGGYEPEYERVETDEAMRTALREKPWDMILCDYRLPQFNGLAAITLLKESGFDIPLIIVSGAIGEDTAADCMRYGAHDYVMKGNLSRLVPAIERELKETESRIQRRQAEDDIIKARKDWEHIFQAIGHPTVILDPRHGILAANKAVLCASGLSRTELLGKKCYEIFHGKNTTSPPEGCPMEKLLASGRFKTVNREMEAFGGVFLVSCTPILNEQGQIEKIIHITTDITDRKRAEEALKNSEARFREMFDDAPIGYHELDIEGRVIRVNRTELAKLDYSAEEMLGRHVWKFVDEKDSARKAVLEKLAGTLPPAQNLERNYCRKDGTRIPMLIQDLLIRDKDGKITGIRTTLQDITERKRTEGELLQTTERLRRSLAGTVQAISMAVEVKDPYTSGHQRRTADLARAIATEMGFTADRTDFVRIATTIHDIGKISVPAEILSKPTKLREIEFGLIKIHPQAGYDILKEIEFPWPVAEVILQHHERMDGSGYPRNLKGEEIIMEARIVSVADVVEAIASHRPYRPALGLNAALDEIQNNRGTLYDADAVDACLRVFRENGYQMN